MAKKARKEKRPLMRIAEPYLPGGPGFSNIGGSGGGKKKKGGETPEQRAKYKQRAKDRKAFEEGMRYGTDMDSSHG